MSKHTQRFLETESVAMGDGFLIGYRVTCSQCGRSETVTSNRTRPLPPEVVRRKFTQKQWHIGKGAADDLCPEHAHPKRERAEKDQETQEMNRVMALAKSAGSTLGNLAATDTTHLWLLRKSLGDELSAAIHGATGDLLKENRVYFSGLCGVIDFLDSLLEAIAEEVSEQREKQKSAPPAPEPEPEPEPLRTFSSQPPPPSTPKPQGIPQSMIDRARASMGMK